MRLKSNAVANGDGGGPIRLGPLMNRFPVPYFRPPDFSRLPGFDNKAKFQENQNIRWQQPKFVPAAGPMERPKTEVSSSMTKMAAEEIEDEEDAGTSSKGKRGRPRKHAPKIPLPPLYVFIRKTIFTLNALFFLRKVLCKCQCLIYRTIRHARMVLCIFFKWPNISN